MKILKYLQNNSININQQKKETMAQYMRTRQGCRKLNPQTGTWEVISCSKMPDARVNINSNQGARPPKGHSAKVNSNQGARPPKGHLRADGYTSAEDNELLQQDEYFGFDDEYFCADEAYFGADNEEYFGADDEEEEYDEDEEYDDEEENTETKIYPGEGSEINYVAPRLYQDESGRYLPYDGRLTEFQMKDGILAQDDIVLITHPNYPVDYYIVEGYWDSPLGHANAFIEIPFKDTGETWGYGANPTGAVDHTKGTIEVVGNLSEYMEAAGSDFDSAFYANGTEWEGEEDDFYANGTEWESEEDYFEAKGKKKKKKGLFGKILAGIATGGASAIAAQQKKTMAKEIAKREAKRKAQGKSSGRVGAAILTGGLSELARKKKKKKTAPKPVTKQIVHEGVAKKGKFFTKAQANKRKTNKTIGKQKGLKGPKLRSFIRK